MRVYLFITKAKTSLVAIEIISAQETTSGQTASTAAFAASITSKPLTLKFGGAVFSVLFPSSRIDASHPFSCEIQC